MQNELLQTGLADQSIALTRVGFTGGVSTSYIDLTPCTGDSPNDPVLKVRGRAVPVIKAKISGIEKSIDSPAANDICNTTQEAVDAIYSFYAIVRLLIGGLSADPRPRPPRRLVRTPTATSTDISGPASRALARSISSRSLTVGIGWPKSRSSGRTFSIR